MNKNIYSRVVFHMVGDINACFSQEPFAVLFMVNHDKMSESFVSYPREGRVFRVRAAK